jgi:ribosomal protein S27E
MGEKSDDGKVRVRCTGCGKRVKYPANHPGGTFRCPICHTVMVAPLDGANELTLEEESHSGIIAAAASAQVTNDSDSEPDAAPSAPPQKPPAIERVNAFLVRETERIGRLCEEVVSNSFMPGEEQANKLRALRHAKAVYFKRYVEAVLKDLDNELAELRDDPASETQTGKSKISRLLLEKRGLVLFLNVMFELRPGASPARNGATPDTRGSAAAPPTTPSQPAAQTPRSTPAADPAPDSKGPGSNGSPSC